MREPPANLIAAYVSDTPSSTFGAAGFNAILGAHIFRR
jgi:hypothetical protein